MELNHHDASSIRRDENFPTVANHVKKEELLRHKLESERLSKRELVERLNAEKEEIKHKAKLVVDMFKQKVAETDRELVSSKLSVESLVKKTQFTNDLLTVHLSKWRIWNDYLQDQDNVDNFAEFLLQQPMRFISSCGSSKEVPVAKPCEIPALMISELDAIIQYNSQSTTDMDPNAIPYLTVVPVRVQRARKELLVTENSALDKGQMSTKQENSFASPSSRRPLKQINMNTDMRDVEQSQSALSPAAKAPACRGSTAKPPKSNKKSGSNGFSIFEDNAGESAGELCASLTITASADTAVVGALQARITSLEGAISLLQSANSRQVEDLAAERAAREAAEHKCEQLSSLQATIDKLDVKVQRLRSNLEKSKTETAEARQALQRERDVYFNVELRHTTDREKLTSAATAQAEKQARELERLQALLAVPNPAVTALEQQLQLKDSELNTMSETLAQQVSSLSELTEELRTSQERFAEQLREQEEASARGIAELRDEIASLESQNIVLIADIHRQNIEIASTSQQLLQTARLLADSQQAHAAALQDGSAEAEQLQLVIAARDKEAAELQQTVQEHLEKISALERRLRTVEDAEAAVNSSLQETTAALVSAQNALTTEVQARSQEGERAAAQALKLQSELSQLRAQLAEAESATAVDAQDAAARIADLSTSLLERTTELGDATGKMAALEVCLHDVRQQEQVYAGQLAEVQEQVEDLQGLVAAKSDLIADLETEVASLQEENCAARSSASEAIAELQAQLWAAATASTARESEISQWTTQLELSVTEWQSKYLQREDGLAAASTFIEQLQHQLENHAARVGQLETEIAEQVASNTRVSAECSRLEQLVLDLQAACSESCQKLAEQESELSVVRGDAEKLSDYCAELLDQVQERESALREAEGSRQTLQLVRDDLQEQVQALTEQLQSAHALVEEAAVELSDLGRDHALEKATLEDKIRDLVSESHAQELTHGAFAVEQQLLLEARNTACEVLQASVITTSTQLEATAQRAQVYEQQLQELRQQVAELQLVGENMQAAHAAATSALELQVRELSCALDAKTVALDEVSAVLTEAQSNLRCCTTRSESLQAEIGDFQLRYDALCEGQALARDEQIALLKDELGANAAKLVAVQSEYQHADTVLRGELASLRETITNLETVAAASGSKHDAELTELRGAIEENERALQEATSANQVLVEQLSSSEDAVSTLRIQLGQAASELSTVLAELLNHRTADQERTHCITSLQDALAAQELQVRQLTGALVAASDSLHSNGAARASAEQQLEIAQAQRAAVLEAGDRELFFRTEELVDLRRAVGERELAIVDLDSCAQHLQRRCSDLEQQLLELEGSLSGKVQQLTQASSELESTKIEVQEVVGQLEDREVHIASLFEELRTVQELREAERQQATHVQTNLLSGAERAASAYQVAAEEEHRYRTAETAVLRNQLQRAVNALLEVDMCERDRTEQLVLSTGELAAFAVKYDEDLCALRALMGAAAEQQSLEFTERLQAEQARNATEVEAARVLLQSHIADHTAVVSRLTAELELCKASIVQKEAEIVSLTENYQALEVQNNLSHTQEVAIVNAQAEELEEQLRKKTLSVVELQAALLSAEAQIKNGEHMLAYSHAAAEEDCQFRSCEVTALQMQVLGAQRAIWELDACVVHCAAENCFLAQLNTDLQSQLDSVSTELVHGKDAEMSMKLEVDRLIAKCTEHQVAAEACATAHHQEIIAKQSALDALMQTLAEERRQNSTAAVEAAALYAELQRRNSETVDLAERRLEDLTALHAKLAATEARLAVLGMSASEAGSQLVHSRTEIASLEVSLRAQVSQVAELSASLTIQESSCSKLEEQVSLLELCCEARVQELSATRTQLQHLESVIVEKEEAHSELLTTLLAAKQEHDCNTATLEAELCHRESEIEQLRVHLSTKENELSAATALHADTADALSALRLQFQQTSEEASGLASEIVSLHHQTSACAQRHGEALAALQESADAKSAAVANLRSQLSSAGLNSLLLAAQAAATEDAKTAESRLQEAAIAHATETAAHNALIDALRAEASKLEADLAEANRLISSLMAQVAESAQECSTLSAALKNEVDIRLAAEQEVITTSDAVCSLQSALQQAKEDLTLLSARSAAAVERAAALEVEAEGLQHELEQAAKAHASAMSTQQDQLALLECERAEVERAAITTQQELTDTLKAARLAEQVMKAKNEASVSFLSVELDNARQEIAVLRTEGSQSAMTIAEIRTALTQKSAQLESQIVTSSKREATIQSLEQSVLHLQSELDNAVLEQQALVSSRDAALHSLREDIGQKFQRILALESKIVSEHAAVEALALEKTELSQSAAVLTADLEAAIREASAAAAAAESQHVEAISALHAEVATLHATNDERSLTITALQSALSDKTSELARLTSTASQSALNSATALQCLEQRVSQLQSEVNLTAQQLQSEQDLRCAAETQVQQKTDEISANRQLLESLRTELQTAQASNEMFAVVQRGEIEQRSQTIASLESRIGQQDAALANLTMDLQTVQRAAEDQRAEHCAVVGALQATIKSAEHEISALCAAGNQAALTITQLESALAEKTHELESLTVVASKTALDNASAVRELEQRLADLLGELHDTSMFLHSERQLKLAADLQLEETSAEMDAMRVAIQEMQGLHQAELRSRMELVEQKSVIIAALESELTGKCTALDAASLEMLQLQQSSAEQAEKHSATVQEMVLSTQAMKSDYETTVDGLHTEITMAQKEITRLNAKESECNEFIATLQQDLTTKIQEHQCAASAVATAAESCEHLETQLREKAVCIQGLEQHIQDIRDDLDIAVAQRDTHSTAIQELHQSVADAQQALCEQEQRSSSTIASLTSEIATLQTALNDAEASAVAMQQKIASMTADDAKLQLQLHEAVTESVRNQESTAELQAKLESELAETVEEVTQLRAQLNEKISAIDTLTNTNAAAEAQHVSKCNQLETMLDQQTQSAERAVQQLCEANAIVAELQRQLKVSCSALRDTEQRIIELQASAQAAEHASTLAQATIQDLQQASCDALSAHAAEMATLNEQLCAHSATASSLRLQLTDKETEVQAIRERFDSVRQEKVAVLEQLQTTESAGVLAKQQLESQLRALSAELEGVAARCEESIQEVKSLHEQLAERAQSMQALESALASAKAIAQEESALHCQEISVLREKFSASESEASQQNKLITDLTADLLQLQTAHEELVGQRDKLAAERDTLGDNLQALSVQYHDSKAAQIALLTQVDSLRAELDAAQLLVQENCGHVDQQAAQITKLEKELDSKAGLVTELQGKLDVATLQWQEDSSTWQERTRLALAEAETRRRDLEQLRMASSQEILQLTSQLSAYTAEVVVIREQQAQRDADLAAASQRLSEVQSEQDLALSTAREELCASTALATQLQAVIADRTAALEMLQHHHDAVLQVLTGLEAEKQELTAQRQQLSAAYTASLESVQALQGQVCVIEADAAAAKAALTESTDSIEVLELDLLTKHTHITELQRTIAEMSETSNTILTEKELAASSAAAEILHLRGLLEQSEARWMECQQQLTAASASHTAEVADLMIVIRERESVAQEINTRFLSMIETTDDLKRRIHEVSQLEQQFRQELAEKTALLDALQMDNGVLAAQDHFRSKELADMQARLHTAETEAASYKQQLHVRTVESVDLTVAIRHKQDFIQELTATVEQTEFQLQQMLLKEAEFAGLLTEVNGKLQKSEEKAVKLDIQVMSQANSVVELKTKLTTAQKALDDERRAWLLAREELESKAQENEFVIQELSSRVEESKSVISLVEDKLAETEAMYVDVCEELNALRAQYHDAASRPASTHHELEMVAMAETIRELEQKVCHELQESTALRSQLESLQATTAHQAQIIAQRDQELQQVVTDHAHLSAHVYEIKSMEVKVATLEELLATAQHELQQYHDAHQEAESEETESEVAASEEIRALQVNLVRLRAKVASKSKQVLLLNQQMLRDRQNFQKLKKSLVKLDGLKSTVFANNYNPAVPAPPLPVNQVSELYHLGMDVATKKMESERRAEVEEQRCEMDLVRQNLALKLAEIENAKFENLSVADECIHQGSMNHLAERITELQGELSRQMAMCQETNRQLVEMRAAKSDTEAAHYLKLNNKVVECTALRAALDHTQKQLIRLKNAQASGTAESSNGMTGHEECLARTTKLETQLQVMTRMQQEGAVKFDKAVRTLKALEARGSSLSKEVVAASAEIQHLNRKLQKPTALEVWEEIEFFA